jgi:hypothetical protein
LETGGVACFSGNLRLLRPRTIVRAAAAEHCLLCRLWPGAQAPHHQNLAPWRIVPSSIHRYTSSGTSQSEKELWSAIDGSLASVGATYADVAAICAAVAVREANADLDGLLAALSNRLPAQALKLVHTDAAAALASCTHGVLHGACVVAGGRRGRNPAVGTPCRNARRHGE